MLTDISNLELSAKYAKKVEAIKNEVLNENSDLCKEVHFVYYRDSDGLNREFYHDPNHKAHCYPAKKEIHLSDTVCEMERKQLYEVILHEMLHVTFADYSEEDIIKETNKRKPKDVRDIIDEVFKSRRI